MSPSQSDGRARWGSCSAGLRGERASCGMERFLQTSGRSEECRWTCCLLAGGEESPQHAAMFSQRHARNGTGNGRAGRGRGERGTGERVDAPIANRDTVGHLKRDSRSRLSADRERLAMRLVSARKKSRDRTHVYAACPIFAFSQRVQRGGEAVVRSGAARSREETGGDTPGIGPTWGGREAGRVAGAVVERDRS